MAFAAALLAGQSAPAQQAVWIGETSGSWSDAANWLDGVAPAAGGSSSQILRFTTPGVPGNIATNDLPGVFALNRLIFETSSVFSLAASAGSSLRLTGADPRIELRGLRNTTLSAPLLLDATSGAVTVTASAPGSLTISAGTLSGGQPLVIDTGTTSVNAGIVTIAGPQTFGGGVVLKSGTLDLGAGTALGTGPLTVRGGVLSVFGITVPNPIALEADLVLNTGFTAVVPYLEGPISSSVAGAGVTMRANGGRLTLTGTSTYTGATTLDYSMAPQRATEFGGRLSLRNGGSALQSSAFHVRAGSTLLLASSAVNNNQVSDFAPIFLRGGGVSIDNSNSGIAQHEIVGVVDGAGFSSLSATSVNNPVRLTAQALTRTERGTFLFSAPNVGSVNGGPFRFNTAPAGLVGGGGSGPATSILPYAVGNNGSTLLGFVTYLPTTGIRLLNDTTEYRATIAAAALNENVRLTAAETLATSRTVNALLLSGGSVNGAGTLTIASGALLYHSGANITAPLNFGAAEANIFAIGNLTITGAISGTNGLTKSGGGTLTLTAANTFTGPLTINSGTIVFASADRLGPDTSALVINGHGAGLSYTGASALNFSRPIETRTGLAKIEAAGTGDLAIATPLVGAGGLQIFPGTATITLPAGSSYAGTTHLGAGRVVIPGDSAFGNGGALNWSGTTLKLTGAWSTAREINLVGSILDTAGFDAQLSGVVYGPGPFTKSGAGTLRLVEAVGFTGTLALTAGTLQLDAPLAGGVTASAGTTVAGMGSVGGTLNVRGILDPGPGAVEFTAGVLQMQANSTLRLRLESVTAYDRLISIRAPSLGGNITLDLQLAADFDPLDNFDQFILIDNASAEPSLLTGNSPLVYANNPLEEGEQFTASGQSWQISYVGGTGNDVTIRAVPEPSVGLALASGFVVLGLRRRRAKRMP